MAAVLVHDIVLLQRMGIRTVVVTGARGAIDRALERASLPSRYHRGLRVTHRADDGARHPRGGRR